MRIAIVSEGYWPEVNGVTVAVERHVEFFRARGHELLLLHPRYPDDVGSLFRAAHPAPRADRLVTFDSEPIAPDRAEARVPSRRGAAEVEEAITRFTPSAVMFHNPDRLVPDLSKPWRPRRVAGLAAARAGRSAIIPIIHTLLPLIVERSGPWYWRNPLAAALARRLWSGIYNDHFDFALTVDPTARDYLASIGVSIPILAGRWNGVDTDVFRPRAASSTGEARPPGAPLRIVSVGRVTPEKNAHLLEPLARSLQAERVPFELIIVGGGALLPALAARFAGVPNVTLRGWRAPPDVAAELARADVYLSLSDSDSFSLTAEEALAVGVPVIAPEVVGFKRLAGREQGLLFPGDWLSPSGMRSLAARIREEVTPARRRA